MRRFRFVKNFDIKAPDPYVLRSRIEEWVENRYLLVRESREEMCKCEDEKQRKNFETKYNNNFALLEHVIRFMCEVDLMSERVGREYMDKLYAMLLDDVKDYFERKKVEE